MKTEQGLVIEVTDSIAKIRVGRHSDCKNCGACPGSNSIIVNAKNEIGAKPGQRVVIEVRETNVLGAAFIVFVLPLIALFIGVMLGGLVGKYTGVNIHTLQVIGGVVAFLLSIVVVKIFDKSASANEKSQPVIVRIL
jgi:sigma-E factor negative regulatory protein RseC